MSFSGEIKDELLERTGKNRQSRLAELSALLCFCGEFGEDRSGTCTVRVQTENFRVVKKCFTLLKKTFKIGTELLARRNISGNGWTYFLFCKGEALSEIREAQVSDTPCKRAYLRGSFLAAGSMSDPHKSYHLEIVCGEEDQAEILQELMQSFSLDAKVVPRKKSYIVYLKEGSQIVDMLNVMEARVALMELENVRIIKETRNSVNRKVNCETANISKTVSAAIRQIEDITYLQDTIGFDKLPEGLRDVALTRLAYPEATLKELGSLLRTPIGKSGVNHRLRKLSEIANQIREQ